MNRTKIFLYSFLLYTGTLAVGLMAAWRHVIKPELGSVVPIELTLGNGAMFLAVFVIFTFVMVRFGRTARIALPLLLLIAMLAGANFALSSWLVWPYSIVGALLVVALALAMPVVLTHDLALLIGIAGISSMLGLSLTPLVACGALALLSLYDIVSVYRTRHMVALAGNMISSGAVFGFLVPLRLSGFFTSRRQALDSRQVMMLGSGDIGLPLILVTSIVSQSINAAILVGVFALAGLMLMHWLFAHQERREPMAALPPIAMAAILGYVLAIVLGI